MFEPPMHIPLGDQADSPEAADAFATVCTKLPHITRPLLAEALELDLQSTSPCGMDLEWLVTEGGSDADGDLVRLYIATVNEQFHLLAIANRHTAAMRVLSKRLTDGHEVMSSHARPVLVASITATRTLAPTITPERRICRVLATALAQARFSDRIQDATTREYAGAIDGGNKARAIDQVLALIATTNFDVLRAKRDPDRILAVAHGDVKEDLDWNIAPAAKALGFREEFIWFLTSGAAHTEPWATSNFNEGTTDLYATLALGALVPSYDRFATAIGQHLGIDVTEMRAQVSEVEARFTQRLMTILERAIDALPVDAPARQMRDLRRIMPPFLGEP